MIDAISDVACVSRPHVKHHDEKQVDLKTARFVAEEGSKCETPQASNKRRKSQCAHVI